MGIYLGMRTGDEIKMNAEVLIGIGEEVIVTRPNIFGPLPKDIAEIVFKSIKLRRMAHINKYNEISKKYNLVGIVGSERHPNINDLNKLIL